MIAHVETNEPGWIVCQVCSTPIARNGEIGRAAAVEHVKAAHPELWTAVQAANPERNRGIS